jgi:hypothetical protein
LNPLAERTAFSQTGVVMIHDDETGEFEESGAADLGPVSPHADRPCAPDRPWLTHSQL